MSSGLRLTALFVCLAMAAPAAAQDKDKDESFRRGLDARGDKKWQEVVTQMRSAIQTDSQESTRKVSRGLFGRGSTEYLPHFFLGEALFNLNDCASAVEEWSVSEQQRAVNSSEFAKAIQEGYRACSSKGVLAPRDFNPLLVQTRTRITEVTELAQTIRDTGQRQTEIWTPQVNEQYERARNELVTAGSRLADGTRKRSATDFSEATAAAERAAGLLRSLDATLNAEIRTLTSLQGQANAIEDLIAGAESADRSIEALGGTLPPALAESRANARGLITRSRATLQDGVRTRNAASANEALKYAQEASGILNQVIDQIKAGARQALEQRLAEAVALATEAFSFVEASFATLDRLTVEKPAMVRPEMAAERAAAQKQIEALRRRFERARRAEDVAGIQQVARLTTEGRSGLDEMIKSFGPLTLRDRGVHASVEAGARAYFDGEYKTVLTALDPANTPTEAPLQLHVHLFRAAALYALYVRSGERDQSLRTQALAEIEQCKQLNPAFVPDSRAFGPRFISFFNQGGAQRTAAAGTAVANP
jgi:hypothetical protein